MKSWMVRFEVIGLVVMAATAGSRLQSQAGPALYTQAQAARGQQAYTASCASCHGADLKGINDAPPLAGEAFLMAWGGQRVSDLVGFVQQSMPPSGPGAVTPAQKADIVAHILNASKFPAGTTELEPKTEVLKGIKIEMKK